MKHLEVMVDRSAKNKKDETVNELTVPKLKKKESVNIDKKG